MASELHATIVSLNAFRAAELWDGRNLVVRIVFTLSSCIQLQLHNNVASLVEMGLNID